MTATDHDTSAQTDPIASEMPAAASADAPALSSTPAPGRSGRRGGGRGRGRGAAQPAGDGQARDANTGERTAAGPKPAPQHPLLAQLAQWYPALFGETLRPLKRGIFEDLLAAHPEDINKDALKAALGWHARSTRYLTAVASGLQRHDLAGQPVEDLTPEQVHHALIEVFRRRGARSREDLRPKLRQRILKAFEASGLERDDYATRVLGRDEEVNQLTRDALDEAARLAAREAAVLWAFEASGQTVEAFAGMYGLSPQDAQRTLERARARQPKTDTSADSDANTNTDANAHGDTHTDSAAETNTKPAS